MHLLKLLIKILIKKKLLSFQSLALSKKMSTKAETVNSLPQEKALKKQNLFAKLILRQILR